MPFSSWRRSLLRALTGVALYLGLWLAELTVIGLALRRPVQFGYFFWDAPPLVNTLTSLLIPAIPLAVIGWFYKGRRRDFALIFAAVLFAVFLWIPWLGTISTPIPVDKLTAKVATNGYEVCGIYRVETVESVFVYEETLSSPKACAFIILRPEPRFNYKLLFLDRTIEVKFLKGVRSNMYTFEFGGTFATQAYIARPVGAPPPGTRAGDFIVRGVFLTTAAGANAVADDWISRFYFSPEPGGAEVRVVITLKLRAEPYVPWS